MHACVTHMHTTHACCAQIPTTMPEEALHAMFSPYGNIVELHMLKKNPGAGELVCSVCLWF